MDIVNLNAERAQRFQDASKWTPVEMLEELLQQAKDGDLRPVKMAVVFLEGDDEAGYQRSAAFAGVTKPEAIAMLAVAHADALDEWRK